MSIDEGRLPGSMKMGKKSKKGHGKAAPEVSLTPIGFTSVMPGTQPLGSLAPIQVAGAQASAVPPLAAVPTTLSTASSTGPTTPPTAGMVTATGVLPAPDQALAQDAQRRLVDLAVEKETLSVRLEDAARQRTELEAKLAELSAMVSELKDDRSGSQDQVAALIAERDKLTQENRELQDEILRLPIELEAVSKSRAFRIMKAAPILAIRKPLSTLLIVGAMGALANLWDFSNVARSIYLVVGAVVLLVSAIQFLSRND